MHVIVIIHDKLSEVSFYTSNMPFPMALHVTKMVDVPELTSVQLLMDSNGSLREKTAIFSTETDEAKTKSSGGGFKRLRFVQDRVSVYS